MPVQTFNGVTTISPTGWKWAVAGIATMAFLPGFGFLVGLALLFVASGRALKIVVNRDAIEARSALGSHRIPWSDVDEFDVRPLRVAGFTLMQLISLSLSGPPALKLGARLTLPAFGLGAEQALRLLRSYRAGRSPRDTTVEPAESSPRPTRRADDTPRPVFRKPAPRSVPRPRPSMRRSNTNTSLVGKTDNPTLVKDGGGFRLFKRRPSSPFEKR